MLAERGFMPMDAGFRYSRQVNGIHHFIWGQVLRGGTALRIWVFPWLPQGQAPYDMRRFPDGVAVYAGGALGERRVGMGGKTWPIATAEQVQASYRDVLQLLDSVGIPMLDSVVTKEALAQAVLPGERVAAGGIPRADLILDRAKPFDARTK